MEYSEFTPALIERIVYATEEETALEVCVEDKRETPLYFTFYRKEDWDVEQQHTTPTSMDIATDIIHAIHPLEDECFSVTINNISEIIDGDNLYTNEIESLVLIRGAEVIVTIGEESMGVAVYEN